MSDAIYGHNAFNCKWAMLQISKRASQASMDYHTALMCGNKILAGQADTRFKRYMEELNDLEQEYFNPPKRDLLTSIKDLLRTLTIGW